MVKDVGNLYYPIVIMMLCVTSKVVWDAIIDIISSTHVIDKHIMSSYKLPSYRATNSSYTQSTALSHALTAPLVHTLALTQKVENLKLAIQA